jgi:serine acetyltransferase
VRRHYWTYVSRPHVAVQRLLERWIGIPLPRWLVNFFFQRVLRLNADVPFQVHFTSTVSVGQGIVVGRNVWKSFALSGGCYIQGGNGIRIDDDTIFAPGVKIISANHARNDVRAWEPAPPLCVGKRCWIASNAVILPGVQLGDDVVVGAGAVVNRSFPSGSVIGGVPARILSAKPVSPGESACLAEPGGASFP